MSLAFDRKEAPQGHPVQSQGQRQAQGRPRPPRDAEGVRPPPPPTTTTTGAAPRLPAQRKLTASGFALRDAYRALNAALSERDAERACCLAVELLATEGEIGALTSHLVDVFGEHHVACVDGEAIERIADALDRLLLNAGESGRTSSSKGAAARNGTGPGTGTGTTADTCLSPPLLRDRRAACGALCEAVITLAVGLTRVPSSTLRDRAAADRKDGSRTPMPEADADSCGTWVERGMRLAALVKEGAAARAVRVAASMLEDGDGAPPTAVLSCGLVWSAATQQQWSGPPDDRHPQGGTAAGDRGGPRQSARRFVQLARALYHLTPRTTRVLPDGDDAVPSSSSPSAPLPCKATRQRRRGLALAAVLVSAAGATSPRSAWTGRPADDAIRRAMLQVEQGAFDSYFGFCGVPDPGDMYDRSPLPPLTPTACSKHGDRSACSSSTSTSTSTSSEEDGGNGGNDKDQHTTHGSDGDSRIITNTNKMRPIGRGHESEHGVMSYLQLYTTYDPEVVDKVLESRRNAHLDHADFAAPKIIRINCRRVGTPSSSASSGTRLRDAALEM